MKVLKIIALLILFIFLIISGSVSLLFITFLMGDDPYEAIHLSYYIKSTLFYVIIFLLSSWGFYRIIRSFRKKRSETWKLQ